MLFPEVGMLGERQTQMVPKATGVASLPSQSGPRPFPGTLLWELAVVLTGSGLQPLPCLRARHLLRSTSCPFSPLEMFSWGPIVCRPW